MTAVAPAPKAVQVSPAKAPAVAVTGAAYVRHISTENTGGGWRQPKCACGGVPGPSGECDRCRRVRETGFVLRSAVVPSNHSYESSESSAFIPEALRSSGQPLDANARAFMEPRFGHDFSKVRIHADLPGAKVAQDLSARAFAYGTDIGFAPGEYAPHTPKGRWLLAHELAHVVQQSGSDASAQNRAQDSSRLEAQADKAATAVMHGKAARVSDRTGPRVSRFELCRALLDAPAGPWVAEAAVRNDLVSQRQGAGPIEREFPIPAGSAAPLRTESTRRPNVINPQVVGENIIGHADIAQLNGTTLELIEVKRATWDADGALFAERQLLNYVSQGNRAKSEVTRHWQARGHPESITSVRGMPTTRFRPVSPQRIAGVPVSVSWCRDGVITYKAMGDRDPDIFVCTTSDQGRINAFIERVVNPAHTRLEEFISNEIEGPAAREVSRRSMNDAVRQILRQPSVRRIVPPGLSDDTVTRLILEKLQPFEGYIRSKATELLQRAMAELRRLLQAQIRNLLQTSLNALCATAASLTARELLNEFERRMRGLAMQLIPVAVLAAAQAMIAPMLQELGAIMLEALAWVAAAVAIVIGVILLWEVAAAIVAAGAIESALVAIGNFLLLLFRQLAFG